MIEGYRTLKAGDIRKKRDEFRHRAVLENPASNRGPTRPSEWKPTELIGEKILESDLMISEYRRPLV